MKIRLDWYIELWWGWIENKLEDIFDWPYNFYTFENSKGPPTPSLDKTLVSAGIMSTKLVSVSNSLVSTITIDIITIDTIAIDTITIDTITIDTIAIDTIAINTITIDTITIDTITIGSSIIIIFLELFSNNQ